VSEQDEGELTNAQRNEIRVRVLRVVGTTGYGSHDLGASAAERMVRLAPDVSAHPDLLSEAQPLRPVVNVKDVERNDMVFG
jgi:hypothetical protein